MLGVSHYLKNEFFVLVYRVFFKVIFSQPFFLYLFILSPIVLLLFIKSKFFDQKTKLNMKLLNFVMICI
jgi:hypothetical protein